MALKSRRTNPPICTKYGQFKGSLREDFEYSCVFCGLHENEFGGPRIFAVEHYKPKDKFGHLELVYENLLYACSVCNGYKLNDWPSDNPIQDGKGYIDPCLVDFEDHFHLDLNSGWFGKSPVADYMVKRLRLNRRQIVKTLQTRVSAEKMHSEALDRIGKVIELIRRLIDGYDAESKERRELDNEIAAYTEERKRIEDKWRKRWEPQIDLDDYRET